MSYYVLDTDTSIYWLNGKEGIREKVGQHSIDQLRTTMITLAELKYGAYNSQRVAENSKNIADFLCKVRVLPLDQQAVDRFGAIKAGLRRKGQPISDFDLLIAAITLEYDGILVTNNLAHFARIPGLRYENWLAE